jgi:poly [ADP-ribose] polymerase 10/14/15
MYQDDRLMFHGSAPEVIPKICQQGFNRSFCGKNAVVYGKVGTCKVFPGWDAANRVFKTPSAMNLLSWITIMTLGNSSTDQGVYFANNSLYSNRYSFSDSKSGVKRMFLCRVLVGEFCKGNNGQLVPDERDASNNVLYDSTTDSLDVKQRDMFVTYHDAQAYPEYLLEYKIED